MKRRELARCLGAWRRYRGLTYRGLGKASGLSATYLCDVEKGRKALSMDACVRIAGPLGVSLSRLVEAVFVDMLPRRKGLLVSVRTAL